MYIEGVINVSGNLDIIGKSGTIRIPDGTPPLDPLNAVVEYIKHIDPTRLSSPASDSVYSALLAKYPYQNTIHP